jgi:hypothetical protein
MSFHATLTPEFHRLVDRMIDERITDDELRRLDELLRGNIRAQLYLVDYCQFHTALALDVRAQSVVDQVAAKLSAKTKPTVGTRRSKSPTPSAVVAGGASGNVSRTWSMAAWGTVAVAVSVVLAWGPAMSWIYPDAAGPAVASLPAGVSWPEVTAVSIESGSVELGLANIGTVRIEGPADFKLLGPHRARLDRGRLKLRVTDIQGHGFVVETPHGEITDLGTEFALEVSDDGNTGVVVYDGKVDLRVPSGGADSQQGSIPDGRRLERGDGVVVDEQGKIQRIMSIVSGKWGDLSQRQGTASAASPLIVEARDNLRYGDTMGFYQITPGGLREDSIAYVDRVGHEWNGVDDRGLPSYLVGADYVMPFNNDKMRTDFELEVTLSRPAMLYVFFDKRIAPPEWLAREFSKVGDEIGLDMGPIIRRDGVQVCSAEQAVGPGNSVDEIYEVWCREVPQAGKVVLGANLGQSIHTGMYGIAATELD